jgi:hypothetical protein
MTHLKKIATLSGLLLATALTGAASAAETASATITATPLGGGVNQFNIALTNTSTTSIGTFWFSWLPGYDFMNVSPTNITVPTGWVGTAFTDGPPEGYSMETYNNAGPSDQLAPGATDNFSFDSTETLAQISGPGAGPLGGFYNQVYSYVYAGQPETDAGFPFNVTPVVPEPVSASIMALGAGALMLRRRRA